MGRTPKPLKLEDSVVVRKFSDEDVKDFASMNFRSMRKGISKGLVGSLEP